MQNKTTIRFKALSQNESYARVCVGVFASQLNPTLSELADIKTAVSEAVTNAIIHAYDCDGTREVEVYVQLNEDEVYIEVRDSGKGICDVSKAREPFYTSCNGEERSGMGFTVMETFMDKLDVRSVASSGTVVKMTKRIVHG